MIDEPLYLRLKQIAVDGSYTSAQAEGLTYRMVRSLLGEGFPISFFRKMKQGIINYLSRLEAEAWLEANYPNVEADIETEQGKTKVTVWPDGRPDA